MRLTLSVYVSVEREEGRSIYHCRPLRGPQVASRDPLLSIALSKIGNKMRKTINTWVEDGHAQRVSPWLYDAETQARTSKLTLILRDRTLRWKLLLVSLPAFARYVAFSPSIADTSFEVQSLNDLESRAVEVYSAWAANQVAEGEEHLLDTIGSAGDMWVEPIEVDVETKVRGKKKSKNILADLFGGGHTSGSEELYKVGHCLDELAADYESAIGRTELVDEIDRILAREDRQGVLVVGPPAVGKTAIIQECVQRRAERFRQRRDQKPQVWWLSPQRLISGMSYLGQWEQRWLSILRESAKRDHVLYFDDLVGLFTAGRTRDSSLSAADVLRGFLAENRVRILAESTAEQLAVLRRRDRALADRFHLIHVPALSVEDALPITLEASQRIEIRSQRYFHPETVPLVMRHQETFAPDRAFPGKAIEMCKTLSKHALRSIDRQSVYQLAGSQVGANLMLLLHGLGDQQQIGVALERELIGQPTAIAALSRTVVRYAQQLQPPDRPLGVLLLLGPTGVGKTEAAKALTRLLYTDESHLVRLDMNELTTPYAAEQLVGTFDQPEGRLTSAVRRQPNCVILLDEIEKAHPDVFDYLLQVLGEGRLTDARGRVADFRSAIIILTSNLGAEQQSTSLGFDITSERRQQIYMKAAQQFFRPEFFNRIDEVVAFRSLDPTDMEKIVAIQMDQVFSRDGIKRRNIFVDVAPSAIKHVIQRGYDSKLGARAVRRMLEGEIIGPLGDCLSQMQLEHPALVHISHLPSQPRLACHVTPLEVAKTRTQKRVLDLNQLEKIGAQIYDDLDHRLNTMADELREIDLQVTGQSHGASYYALREQLYRCLELLKTVRARLSRKQEPRLDVPSQSPSRPRRDSDGAGARRGLKDWQAQQDLHAAIREHHAPSAHQESSNQQTARQLVDGLTVASAMIESALAPRTWLVGFQSLTEGPQQSNLGLDWSSEKPLRSRAELFDDHRCVSSALSRVINCLKYRWQYELLEPEVKRGFWQLSGVSLIGILGPLLGTYRVETRAGASHLVVLRAIAVADVSAPQIDPLINFSGETDQQPLWTPPEQPFPTQVIRGSIGTSLSDYVYGATTTLFPRGWYENDKELSRTMEWWLGCLPVPGSLLE